MRTQKRNVLSGSYALVRRCFTVDVYMHVYCLYASVKHIGSSSSGEDLVAGWDTAACRLTMGREYRHMNPSPSEQHFNKTRALLSVEC